MARVEPDSEEPLATVPGLIAIRAKTYVLRIEGLRNVNTDAKKGKGHAKRDKRNRL